MTRMAKIPRINPDLACANGSWPGGGTNAGPRSSSSTHRYRGKRLHRRHPHRRRSAQALSLDLRRVSQSLGLRDLSRQPRQLRAGSPARRLALRHPPKTPSTPHAVSTSATPPPGTRTPDELTTVTTSRRRRGRASATAACSCPTRRSAELGCRSRQRRPRARFDVASATTSPPRQRGRSEAVRTAGGWCLLRLLRGASRGSAGRAFAT